MKCQLAFFLVFRRAIVVFCRQFDSPLCIVIDNFEMFKRLGMERRLLMGVGTSRFKHLNTFLDLCVTQLKTLVLRPSLCSSFFFESSVVIFIGIFYFSSSETLLKYMANGIRFTLMYHR